MTGDCDCQEVIDQLQRESNDNWQDATLLRKAIKQVAYFAGINFESAGEMAEAVDRITDVCAVVLKETEHLD